MPDLRVGQTFSSQRPSCCIHVVADEQRLSCTAEVMRPPRFVALARKRAFEMGHAHHSTVVVMWTVLAFDLDRAVFDTETVVKQFAGIFE